jgi:hypothetical protein
MAKKPDERRKTPAQKAQDLQKRFPITDLSRAVALSGGDRRFFLREFVEQFINTSYQPTRDSAHMIYAVREPLIYIAPEPWSAIKTHIANLSRPTILNMNLTAARLLFDFIREKDYVATNCPRQDLWIGTYQSVSIGLTFYVTEGDRVIFQFQHPRRESLSPTALVVPGSIMHHAYAHGDFARAEMEVVDLGCPPKSKERLPRVRHIARDQILDLAQLKEQIQDVYNILSELAARRS